MKKVLIVLMVVLTLFVFTSCDMGEDRLAQGETYEDMRGASNYKVEANVKQGNSDKVHEYETVLEKKEDILNIGEKLYLTQINDIYNNIQRYQDKTVVVQGMIGTYETNDKTFTSPLVYRNGPGCCGNDGWGGFYLNDLKGVELRNNDWIEVTGKPVIYEKNDARGVPQKYLFLDVSNIKKCDERGAEYVPD